MHKFIFHSDTLGPVLAGNDMYLLPFIRLPYAGTHGDVPI